MRSDEIHDRVLRSLLARQSPLTAGWGYHSGQQATEPTCLALLALRNVSPKPETDGRKSRNRYGSEEIRHALEQFRRRQNPNGSWSAFDGDDEIGCSITALAIITLIQTSTATEQVCSAVDWLLNARGREAHWLWQWKFRIVDSRVKIDPAKFGWSWLPGTMSWVIPTSLAVIALAQARRAGLNTTEDLNQRLELGRAMLLDRMCPRGGWNSGNGIAFGVALTPHVDSTAIALLALRPAWDQGALQSSLLWLVKHTRYCPSAFSVAWSLLAMAAYRDVSEEARDGLRSGTDQLMRFIENVISVNDNCTLAISALALEAIQGQCVFEVRA